MSDETTETDADVIATWRAELDDHDRDAQDGGRTWHFTHYVPDDPEPFIRAALRTIDALTTERDAARKELATLREACDGVPELLMNAWAHYLTNTKAYRVDFNPAKSLREAAEAIRAALGESEVTE